MKFPVAKAGTIQAAKNNAGILIEKKKNHIIGCNYLQFISSRGTAKVEIQIQVHITPKLFSSHLPHCSKANRISHCTHSPLL